MDNYFPDDEYQTPQVFTKTLVESQKLNQILELALNEIPAEQVGLLSIQVLHDPDMVQKISKILISESAFVPSAILISVKSYRNPEGKERPVSWYAETELRRTLLVEAEGHGLGVYYRSIYPNPYFIAQLRVATNDSSDFLPMSCLFLGYQDHSQGGSMQRFEAKVKRDQESADYWSAGL